MRTKRWNGVKHTTYPHHTISDVITALRPAAFMPDVPTGFT